MSGTPVNTPILRKLKAASKRRQVNELFLRVPLSAVARAAPLGADATLLYIVLVTIQQCYRRQFFGMRPEFEDALGRNRRWIQRHGLTLEQANLIEIQRKPGNSARYRVLGDSKQAAPRDSLNR